MACGHCYATNCISSYSSDMKHACHMNTLTEEPGAGAEPDRACRRRTAAHREPVAAGQPHRLRAGCRGRPAARRLAGRGALPGARRGRLAGEHLAGPCPAWWWACWSICCSRARGRWARGACCSRPRPWWWPDHPGGAADRRAGAPHGAGRPGRGRRPVAFHGRQPADVRAAGAWCTKRFGVVTVLLTAFAAPGRGGRGDGGGRATSTASPGDDHRHSPLETSKGDLPLALALGGVLLGVVGVVNLFISALHGQGGANVASQREALA